MDMNFPVAIGDGGAGLKPGERPKTPATGSTLNKGAFGLEVLGLGHHAPMIGMVWNVSRGQAALPKSRRRKGADCLLHRYESLGRSLRRFPNGLGIELPVQANQDQPGPVLRYLESTSVHQALEHTEAGIAEGFQHGREARGMLFLKKARDILEGKEMNRGAGVQLLEDAGELQRKAMPRVVLGAVRGTTKALAGRAPDDPDRTDGAASQLVELGGTELRHIPYLRNSTLLGTIVIVGLDAVRAYIDRDRDGEACRFESPIEASCPAE